MEGTMSRYESRERGIFGKLPGHVLNRQKVLLQVLIGPYLEH